MGVGEECAYERQPSARHVLAVQKAMAGTERSTLDLLGLAWPFSQVGLLTAEEFVKEVQHRRIDMSGGRRSTLLLSATQRWPTICSSAGPAILFLMAGSTVNAWR